MARQKNGWIKIYSSILDKGFSPTEFKIWVGLCLIANTQKSNSAGLVDLPLRIIAKRLGVSLGSLISARDKFITEDRVKPVKLPSKTKPITGLQIINFALYQGKQFVPQSEQSQPKKVPPTEHSVGEIVPPTEQKVHSIEQSVSKIEHSLVQNAPPKNNKEYTEKDHGQGTTKSPDPLNEKRKLVFEGLKERRGYSSPLAGAEAKAISWMLQQGYSVELILSAHDKLKKDKFWGDKFLNMQSVKAQIGEVVKGKAPKGEHPTTEELEEGWKL